MSNHDTGICRNCGQEFERKRYAKKYCSNECYWDRQERERLAPSYRIFARDGFRCFFCGRNPQEHKVELTIDHLFPKAQGGEDGPNNTVTCCSECNSKKGRHLLDRETMERFYAVLLKKNGAFTGEDYERIMRNHPQSKYYQPI